MFEIVFYEDSRGKSEILERLYEFRAKAKTSKNDRINYEKIMAYIDFLAKNGTKIGEPYVK